MLKLIIYKDGRPCQGDQAQKSDPLLEFILIFEADSAKLYKLTIIPDRIRCVRSTL